jgi:hypothetical protein
VAGTSATAYWIALPQQSMPDQGKLVLLVNNNIPLWTMNQLFLGAGRHRSLK